MHNIYDQLHANFVKLTLKLNRLDNGIGLSQWLYVYDLYRSLHFQGDPKLFCVCKYI